MLELENKSNRRCTLKYYYNYLRDIFTSRILRRISTKRREKTNPFPTKVVGIPYFFHEMKNSEYEIIPSLELSSCAR